MPPAYGRRGGLFRRVSTTGLHHTCSSNTNETRECADFEGLREQAVALRRRHPNAKDDLRERARELRRQGWTYDQIQLELGCSRSSVIHESADVDAAQRHWADISDVDSSVFQKATLKKHDPKTVRKNTGDDYHGCLVVSVPQSADPYTRVDGWWDGIVAQAQARLR